MDRVAYIKALKESTEILRESGVTEEFAQIAFPVILREVLSELKVQTDSGRVPVKEIELHTLMNDGNPQTSQDKVLFIGYWLMFGRGEEEFSLDRVREVYKGNLREIPPGNLKDIPSQLKRKGWFAPAKDTKGWWKLTQRGQLYVEESLKPEKKFTE